MELFLGCGQNKRFEDIVFGFGNTYYYVLTFMIYH